MSDMVCIEARKGISHVERLDKTKDILENNATNSLELKAPITGVSDMTIHNESPSTSCQELSVLNGITQMPRQLIR